MLVKFQKDKHKDILDVTLGWSMHCNLKAAWTGLMSHYLCQAESIKFQNLIFWNLDPAWRGELEVRLGGGLKRGLQRGLQTGYGRGLAVKLRSCKVQVRSGPGLVHFIDQI